VIVLYIILSKTTFGYELKACGFNPDAAQYAGINSKRSIILSMMIAGAMAGVGGGLIYLAGSGKFIEVVDILAAEGFTGISVALLGLSHPIGILFSGLFISYIYNGGFYLQLYDFVPEIIDIIIAIIIYFSAFALIVRQVIQRYQLKKEMEGTRNALEPDIPPPDDKADKGERGDK
jgi:simple sugar transport system permease protein